MCTHHSLPHLCLSHSRYLYHTPSTEVYRSIRRGWWARTGTGGAGTRMATRCLSLKVHDEMLLSVLVSSCVSH